jgi:N-acetylglucosamine kinase-like BadF-type ATPase
VSQPAIAPGFDFTTRPPLLSLPDALHPLRAPTGSAARPRTSPWLLGLDGGATKTTAAVFNVDTYGVWLGRAGSSNPFADGFDAAVAAIRAAVRAALGAAGIDAGDIAAGVMAIASADTAVDQARLHDGLVATQPVHPLIVVNDVVAAWCAGTLGGPGVAVIAGTGSNSFGVNARGQTWRCGGWGHLLDDTGSAYWIGLEVMRAAVRYRDGRGPYTQLVHRLLAEHSLASVEDLQPFVYEHFNKARIASFARLAAAAATDGDGAARRILHEAGTDLARMVCTVIEVLDFPETFPVVLVGGTFGSGSPFLTPFAAAVHEVRPGASLIHPRVAPVGGSVWLAARAAGLEAAMDPDRFAKALSEVEG